MWAFIFCGILNIYFYGEFDVSIDRTGVGGRPPSFTDPEAFKEKCLEYIEWVKNNPVEKTITASFQGVITHKKVPHMRGMTQFGLATYLGVGITTLKNYGKHPEFMSIFEGIDAMMKAWNLDGAMSGDLNVTLVARIDGHADKTETDITTNGESINKQNIDMSKLSDDELRNLDSIISKANQSGAIEKESD